jgi:hypothetical protein
MTCRPGSRSGRSQGLTRREAVGAGATGLTVLALGADAAGAATNATASRLHRTVTINAPRDVVFDLAKVQRIRKDILGQFGCRACCSGFDFHFPDELEYVFPAQGVAVREVTPQEIVDAVGEAP